jgi:hypothetical protein
MIKLIIGIKVDENNKVIRAFPDNINGDIFLDADSDTVVNIFEKCVPYKYENEQLIIDTIKQGQESINAEIAALEEFLRSTDWMVVKQNEYELTGRTIDFDYSADFTKRQEARDRINQLQSS